VAELANAAGLGPVGRKSLEVRVLSPALALLLALAVVTGASGGGAAAPGWHRATPLPVARTEVSAARLGSEIVVVGGFLANGASTARVDAYTPRTARWRRLRDLPAAVNHAAAASAGRHLYVVGGYGAERRLFDFFRGRWHALPPLPESRAAAGAAIVGGKLYVVGGVTAPGQVATRMLVFDLRRRRWGFARGPIPREHLAVTALGGRVYALAGRASGVNFRYLQTYSPVSGRWRTLASIPVARSGTGVAAVGRTLISIGGEQASEGATTIASVYAYSVDRRRWSRLPDLPTPRHGLGVVAFGRQVYAIAGGPEPGLHVSAANEFLTVR
jgi:hypothetical protein